MNPIEITALPASDKRALVDALNAARIPLILGAAPTVSTEGRKGQLAIWVESGEAAPRYAMCVKAESGVYTWREHDLLIKQETAPTEGLFAGLLWVRPSTGAISVRNPTNTGWNVAINPVVPDAYSIGELTGTVTLNRGNGQVQRGYISATTMFNAPTGSFPGAKLTIAIDYVIGTPDINFTGVEMDDAAAALLPITLDAAKAYQLELSFVGGGWVLTDILGPYTQTLYP